MLKPLAFLAALALLLTPITATAWKHGNAATCSPPISDATTAGFCTQTFDISGANSQFTTAFVDQSATKGTGFKLYYNQFFSQTAQPANVTLNTTSADVGENNQAFQGTLSTATALGSGPGYRGTAFGGGGYFEVTTHFTASNQNAATWEAPGWLFSLECSLGTPTTPACYWPGTTASYFHYGELDIIEHFMGAFSNSINNYSSTSHDWSNASKSTNIFDSQTFTPAGGSASYSSDHKYGMLWTVATGSAVGSVCYYYDRVKVGSCDTYHKYSYRETLTASFTSGVTTTLTTTDANAAALGTLAATDIVSTYVIYDITAGCKVGSYNGTWATNGLQLSAAAGCSSTGSTDVIQIAPAQASPSGKTWLYGVIDDQHFYFEGGCMNTFKCNISEMQVWQAGTSNNLSNP